MKQSELVTVGWAYGQAEAALAIALLAASGIKAFPHGWHVVSVQWSWAHAVGGIALQVQAEHAGDAVTLLAGNSMMRRPRNWWRRALAAAVVVVFLIISVPPPASGFYAAAWRLPRQRPSAEAGAPL